MKFDDWIKKEIEEKQDTLDKTQKTLKPSPGGEHLAIVVMKCELNAFKKAQTMYSKCEPTA